MKGIAVIPARGGSKRIPKKNLLVTGGRPMIERPIRAAYESGLISDVLVSTDDDDIARLAEKCGASIFEQRPKELSGDQTTTAPVIIHELDGFFQRGGNTDFVAVLYPTSIFISGADLITMANRLFETRYPVEMVMTATKYPAPIERRWHLHPNGVGEQVDPNSRNKNSDSFPESFYDAGQAYVSVIDAWTKIERGTDVATALHVLPASRAWDINVPDDVIVATALRELLDNQTP